MAARLVKEVITFCRTEAPIIFLDHSPTRLSFICHSLGGLIVRKALEDPEMAPLLPKLHMFLSMACPHLGTTPAPSISLLLAHNKVPLLLPHTLFYILSFTHTNNSRKRTKLSSINTL